MKKSIIAVLVAALGFTSCKKDDDGKNIPNLIEKGPEVTAGQGKAWTWIETTSKNVPVAVAIVLTDKAVPDEHGFSTKHEGEHGTEVYELDLPASKANTVFDHVTVDWNPEGHPPANVYSFAHFDFHYYMINRAQRQLIPAFETDSTGFKKYPAPAYLPADYFPIPGGQAQMGVHWADPKSPELNPGGTFTQTFIYGTYNNSVNFYEPMVTRKFLKELTSPLERSIPQPDKVDKTGYYPTKMVISKIKEGYQIKLVGFVLRTKS